MISTTLYLAAAEESADPWHVLGNPYAPRLAIAALADLGLTRRLSVAPGAMAQSPATRLLEVLPGPPPPGVLRAALAAMVSTGERRDVDRVVHLLGDLSPAIAADLVASGELVVRGQTGRWRKRPVLAAVPEARVQAQSRIRSAAGSPAPADRALALVASAGMPAQRLARLCGGLLPAHHDPFERFDPASPAADGRPLGDKAADLLTTLITVLAATQDTTNDFE